jgi:hypothetical protein
LIHAGQMRQKIASESEPNVGNMRSINRLALYGIPGAGKSTTTRLVRHICQTNDIEFSLIKLAEPLYAAQQAIYSISGRPLDGYYQQDGELLSFLGIYMRKINPDVLIETFRVKLNAEVERLNEINNPALIICDDMRRPDAQFLQLNGFKFVRIIADEGVCVERKKLRGDLSVGSSTHPSEAGLDDITPHFTIMNNSSIAELELAVEAILREDLHDIIRP